jgi:hypothetical protein
MNNIAVHANQALNVRTNADNSQLKEKVQRLANVGKGVSYQVTRSKRNKKSLRRPRSTRRNLRRK